MSLRQLDFLAGLLRVTRDKLIGESRPVPPPAPEPAKLKAPRPPRGDDTALAARCVEWLGPLNCPALAERVRVTWSGRLRSTAGLAYPGKGLIKLNPRLKDFGEAEVERTLRHELAHLLAQHRVGRRRIAPHGAEWRKACADLGAPDEARCHTLPLPRKTVERRHLYRCAKCGVEVRRVRPFRRATACLKCCRQFNGGRFNERFRFVKIRL